MSTGRKVLFLFLSIFVGTMAGHYLYQFEPLSRFFDDLMTLGFDMKRLDLVFMDMGLYFHLNCNLGTILGGIAGLWIMK